ncbi:ATP-binding protein [Photobacterium leiognathi]|uniref:ATP-binding protein n=1 Tax=Photobacterium leiognathi TaxID=553611 RepID=UPI002980D003|nr:ATP-binding protein [Photobacterium leiognathi]
MTTSKETENKFFSMFDENNLKIDESENVFIINRTKHLNEAILLESKSGKRFIRKKAKEVGLRLSKKGIEEVIEELETMAFEFDSYSIHCHKRYALSLKDKSVLIDLGNDDIVKVNASGVTFVNDDSDTDGVYFSRSEHQLPMVMPNLELGNDDVTNTLKKLHKYINTDTNTFFLVVCYITYLMANPKAKGVPYPIFVIQGEKGAGKSFFCGNVICNIVDPSKMINLDLTRRADDYAVILNSVFLAVFDNIRTLTKDQSDMLCKTATKSSVPKRKLYTDAEVSLLELHSPVVLNGIHDFIKESDLASRCVHVKLQKMQADKRRPMEELKEELEVLMPDILGALLLLVSKALAVFDQVKVTDAARMMDFSKWIGALELVWHMPQGKLQKAYQQNVESLMASGTIDDSLTIALLKLIKGLNHGEAWKGTPSTLLDKLYEFESSTFLPKGAAALTAKMKGQESSLNANGIYFKMGRDSERYVMVSGGAL